MGAVIMSVMVIVIAIVGYVYFAHQEKKEAHTNKRQNEKAYLNNIVGDFSAGDFVVYSIENSDESKLLISKNILTLKCLNV